MLGNTNIKDGINLNATVEDKVIETGSSIVAGDFVQLTGTASGHIDDTLAVTSSVAFEIDNEKIGYAFATSQSANVRFKIVTNSNVIYDTSITIPSAINDTITFMVAWIVNSKIYLCPCLKSSSITTASALYVYEFNYDTSTNAITYNSTITLTLPNDLRGSSSTYKYYVPIAVLYNDGYIYVFTALSSTSSGYAYNSIVGYLICNKFALSGTAVSEKLFNSNTSNFANSMGLFYIGANYIYYRGVSNPSIFIAKKDLSEDFVSKISNSNSPYSGMFEDGNVFAFCAYSSYRQRMYFYTIENDVLTLKTDLLLGNENIVNAEFNSAIKKIKKVNDKYLLFVLINCNTNSIVATVEYDAINYTATIISSNLLSKTFNHISNNKSISMVTDLEDLSFGVGQWSDNTSNPVNYYNKSGILYQDSLILAESIDKVMNYQNRIDGVAKQSGTAGDTIEVYIPQV